MFRARKATKKQTKARHVDDDSEPVNAPPDAAAAANDAQEAEETDVAAIRERIKQKSKKSADFSTKKRRAPAAISLDEDDDDVPAFRVQKGKIPRVSMPVVEESERSNEYSAERLQELKSQQKFVSFAAKDDKDGKDGEEDEQQREQQQEEQHDEEIAQEEAFIPLNEPSGREKPAYSRIPSIPEEASLEDNENDGQDDDMDAPADDQWEAEQLRRVGIHSAASNVPTREKDLSFMSFGQVVAKLQSHKEVLHERTDVRTRDFQRIEVEIRQLASGIADMEASLDEAGKVYDDVQQLWEYISALCFCLRAKTKELEALEAKSVLQPRAVQEQLWADVSDEFSSLDIVLERFAQWRDGPHGDMYKKTYGGLALEQLIVPYIRVELLSYSPWVHRWEDHVWARTLKTGTSLDLLHVGVELVAAKAEKTVIHLDWLNAQQVAQAQYLLASLPVELRKPIVAKLVQHGKDQTYSWDTNPRAASQWKKHLSLLQVADLDAFVCELCEKELNWFKTSSSLDVQRLHQVLVDWPTRLVQTKPFLREYATLVNTISEESTKRDLLVQIELQLQG